MSGIPNLNKVYEDETGTLYIHDIGGEKQIFVLHAEVIPTTNRKVLSHYRDIIELLYANLAERGVKEIEAWVLTDEQIRFATHYGFHLTGKEITLEGVEFIDPVYQMKKDLT